MEQKKKYCNDSINLRENMQNQEEKKMCKVKKGNKPV